MPNHYTYAYDRVWFVRLVNDFLEACKNCASLAAVFGGAVSELIAKGPEVPGPERDIRVTKFAGRVFLVVFAMTHLWASRYQMNEDGISYLDIGDAFFHGDWRAAVNLCWSPLYPLVLGAVRRALPVPMKLEYPLVHAVNFAIFLLVIPCFEFFWASALRNTASSEKQLPRAEAAWWVVGYSVLVVTAQMQKAIELVTPDLIVTGLVLLAAGILLQVRSATSRDRDFLALGAVLGVGYLAKAPVFPVAFVFFVAAIAGRTLNSRQLLRGGMMIVSFALVSTPLIVFLSKHKGGLSFGESAKLNLAWHINGVVPKYVFWEGGPPGSGMPIHGPRQIWRSPNVYEFASPIHATYPPWYDPYYWHEGVRTHLDARSMPRVAAQSLKVYLRLLLEDYVAVTTILLFLASLRGDWTATFRDLLTYWPLIVVAISALGMFAVILVDPRYVAGYLLLLWAPLLLTTGAFTASNARLARAAAFSLAIMVLPTLRRGVMVERRLDSQQDNFNTALAVQRSGIYPSDKVAYIGDGIQAVWAKLDRVFFVAEAPSHYWTADGKYRPVGSPFWQSSKTEQAAIYDALRRTGAKAILASPPSTQDIPSGWQKVSGTNLRVMFLR